MIRVGSPEFLYYMEQEQVQTRSDKIKHIIADLRRVDQNGEDINEVQFDIYDKYGLDPMSLTAGEASYIKRAVER